MANKDDSFLSKHGDKINAAGHAINTLQNAKIAERQRKIAQLQAATAALQQEENELKKKELQLLEKQQKALEEEQRRARQEQKQKEELKAEMLDVSPKLNRFLNEILQADYVDGFERGKDLYEASSALAYLNEHKGIIEDINLHEYLYQIHEKLNKAIIKFRNDFDSINNYLEEFYTFLEKHSQYFEVILIMLGAKEAKVTQRAKIDQYEKTIQDLIKKNELTSNLRASLQEYKEVFLSKDFKFDDRFVPPPIQRNEYEIIFNFLNSLETGYNNSEIIDLWLKEIKANFLVENCIGYLSSREISIFELKNNLDLIEFKFVKEKRLQNLKNELRKYTKSVRSKLKSLEIFLSVKKYSLKIKEIEKITGIYTSNLENEIEGLYNRNRQKEVFISIFDFIGTIAGVSLLVAFLMFFGTSDWDATPTQNQNSIIILIILAIIFTIKIIIKIGRKNPNEKYYSTSHKLRQQVEKALKPLENWVNND